MLPWVMRKPWSYETCEGVNEEFSNLTKMMTEEGDEDEGDEDAKQLHRPTFNSVN